jgi:amino acid permease
MPVCQSGKTKAKLKREPRLFLLSLVFGVFLMAFLYSLAYLLAWHTQGFAQNVGYLIAMLLAFPLSMFFHDREPPLAILAAMAVFDVLLLSLPAFLFMLVRRK